MSKTISRRSFLKVTGAAALSAGAAGLLSACGSSASSSSVASSSAASSVASSVAEAAPAGTYALADGDVSMTMSWWGGDTRHAAYQAVLEKFHAKYSNITVAPTYNAWSGWEEAMSTKFAAGEAEDVCQVNWNWLYSYSKNAQTFANLNDLTEFLDLSQFDESSLAACTVGGALQCIPVAMTGRIFYWNMNSFKKAGINDVPKSLDDLMAAGKAFKEKLGDDYYPLHLGAYDRMILMVFYLESMYGKDWVDPESLTLQYTKEEIIEGFDFIQSLEDNHVILPLKTYYGNEGETTTTDQSQGWIAGKYAGIFEWDSAPSKYLKALPEEMQPDFMVGEEIKYGDYNGGYAKVSLGLAVTKSSKYYAEGALLIDFTLNSDEGASTLGSECGIPLSKSGKKAAEAALNATTLEANSKVLAFVSNQLDPYFENSKLKGDDGVYKDVFDGLGYGDYSTDEAADALLDGIASVGVTV